MRRKRRVAKSPANPNPSIEPVEGSGMAIKLSVRRLPSVPVTTWKPPFGRLAAAPPLKAVEFMLNKLVKSVTPAPTPVNESAFAITHVYDVDVL